MRSFDAGLVSRVCAALSLVTQAGLAAACARFLQHALRVLARQPFKYANAILGGLLVCVLLGSPTSTTAYFSASQPQGSNVLATASKFTISDLTVVTKPGGGGMLLSWSAASWATGGYSIRRAATAGGPFDLAAQITTVAAGTTTYTDAGGTTQYYEVFGLSTRGGVGGSAIVAATPGVTSITLSANSTDIAAGGNSTITSTVYTAADLLAVGATVSWSISTNDGVRGSFNLGGGTFTASGTTDASGQTPITLYVSAGIRFTPITITATSGAATRTITIVDPAPLPPQELHVSASDRLELSWSASPSSGVTGYQIMLGTATGMYQRVIQVGQTSHYTETAVVAGRTYYVAMRAVGAHGALSDPTPELHITLPKLVATRLTLAGLDPPLGEETTGITATVLDQYGHKLIGALVSFRAPTGFAVEASRSTGDGGAAENHVSRLDPHLSLVTVHAVSGSAGSSLDLTFAPPLATPTPTATLVSTATPTQTSTPTLVRTAAPTVVLTATLKPTPSLEPTPIATLTTPPATPPASSPSAFSTATPTPGVTVEQPSPVATLPGSSVSTTPTPSPQTTATTQVTPSPSSTPIPVASQGLSPTPNSTPGAGGPGVVIPSPSPTGNATGTASRTATATSTATATATRAPLSIGTHGDEDSALDYSSGWSVVADPTATGGHYHRTSANASSVSFTVDTNALSLILWYRPGPSGALLEVFQDGKLIGSVAEDAQTGRASVALNGTGSRPIRLVAHPGGTSGTPGSVSLDRIDAVGNGSPTPTASATVTVTVTPTASPTASPSGTLTVTPTPTPNGTLTATPNGTFTATPTGIFTATPNGTFTATPTGIFTATPTRTATASGTVSGTPGATASATPSPAPTTGAPGPLGAGNLPGSLSTSSTPIPGGTPTSLVGTPAPSPGVGSALATAPPTSTPLPVLAPTPVPTPAPTSAPSPTAVPVPAPTVAPKAPGG